jgi:hypothetical protein
VPSVNLRTTGDLRTFLCDTMERVRDGKIDLAAADRIAKIAGQITASLTAEAQMNLVNHKVGGEVGAMPLVGKTEPEPPMAIEHKPEPAIVNASPPRVPLASGERVFCDQCERRVTAEEAGRCTSGFCKANSAAKAAA